MITEDTYGNEPASIDLVRIINERGFKKTNKIGNILTDFNFGLIEYKKIDSKVALLSAKLLLAESKARCEYLGIPFNTYTANVLHAKYRRWYKEVNGIKSYETRERIRKNKIKE